MIQMNELTITKVKNCFKRVLQKKKVYKLSSSFEKHLSLINPKEQT